MAAEAQNLSREMAHAYLSGTILANRLSSLTCQPIMTLIMQNKPNFRKAKMNLNFYSTEDYENKSNWKLGENKPNTNPIQTQYKPNQTQYKANQSQYNAKTNPIKPNPPAQRTPA